MSSTEEKIRQQIKNNKVILYMKGSPSAPQCGFSSNAVNILKACNIPFEYVNVLDHVDIRRTLPSIANWPTFPQLFAHGELVGGCDIMTELYHSGELQKILGKDTV